MPPQLALLICVAFIVFLLRNDVRRGPNVSYSLLVPLVWLMIYASRPISFWFGHGVADSGEAYLDGSPVDRVVFLTLIVIGIVILIKRGLTWSEAFRGNRAIILYILYLGISTVWSDQTFVAFKRWIKEIGHIVMVLIVLTEPDPVEAVKTMIRRCAFVLLPLSLVLNRYFPQYSRMYSQGGGPPQFIGVATHKNSLGALCLVCGLVLFWDFYQRWKARHSLAGSKNFLIDIVMLLLTAFLLYSSHSATAQLGMLIGMVIIVALNSRHLRDNPRMIVVYIVGLIVLAIAVEMTVGIVSLTSSGMGRDRTLTGRTDFWMELIQMGTNPLIGTGYESFWLGGRLNYFWNKYWWHPNQAHNGYIEIYLNLGLLGLGLVSAFLFSTFKQLGRNFTQMHYSQFNVLVAAFVVIFMVVNFTEAQFKGSSWFIFLLFTMVLARTSNETK